MLYLKPLSQPRTAIHEPPLLTKLKKNSQLHRTFWPKQLLRRWERNELEIPLKTLLWYIGFWQFINSAFFNISQLHDLFIYFGVVGLFCISVGAQLFLGAGLH